MNRIIEHIAYEGEHYTIEWYYDCRKRSQALEYYMDLPVEQRIRVLMLFKRIGDVGTILDKTKFRNEGEQIYAFKPQPERLLCFFTYDRRIIITNAFRKKQDKLPVNEKKNALRCKQDYITRVNAGTYYE